MTTYCTAPDPSVGSSHASPQRGPDGRFHNPVAETKRGFWGEVRLMASFANRPDGRVPSQALPVHPLNRAQLLAAPDRTLFRLGHSTMLLKLRGVFWLTDPVFSKRASPVQWAGPKRFHAPPIALEDLPDIEGVVISHDHYDHLDHASIVALAPRVKHFLTPLGVGDRLIRWGVPPHKVQQLDWWQSTEVEGLLLTATPAQHFSGRAMFDGNKTLWSSWVLVDDELRIFFSGDTGYFDGFKTIGERLGPFDLTLLEAGAYDPRWAYVHMLPEQVVQAHLDLRGRRLLPIHNGTFDLAMHTWQDPFERVTAVAQPHGIPVLTPIMGAPLDLASPMHTPAWWQSRSEPLQSPLGVLAQLPQVPE